MLDLENLENSETCEDLEEIKSFWATIVDKIDTSYLKDAKLKIANMDGLKATESNAIALTEGRADDSGLHFEISFDEVFYDLKLHWQIAVICHEVAHAIRIQEWYESLMLGQCAIDDWKEYAATDGHDEAWEQIAKRIAAIIGIEPDMAAIKHIDFTDNKYFQTQIDF